MTEKRILTALPEGPASNGPHGFHRGLTVLELLTVMGIVSMLVALVLPAVQSSREAARRTQCSHQLKQIGLALHSYHEQWSCLPAAWQFERTGHSQFGWLVPLLPLFEQQAVFQQVDRDRRLDDPVNGAARETSIALLLCPSDIIEPAFVLHENDELTGSSAPLMSLPTANYVAVFGTSEADELDPVPLGEGAFEGVRPVRLEELTRGLSRTLLVGERTMAKVPSTWLGVDALGEDAACRLAGSAFTAPNCTLCDECEFDSRHPGGSNFLFGDGRVTLISESIDTREYRELARRLED